MIYGKNRRLMSMTDKSKINSVKGKKGDQTNTILIEEENTIYELDKKCIQEKQLSSAKKQK
jgi:hypothetical protein